MHAETFLEFSGLLFLGYVLLVREMKRRAQEIPEQIPQPQPEIAPQEVAADPGLLSSPASTPVATMAPPSPPVTLASSPVQEIARLQRLAVERGQGAVPELARALRHSSPEVAQEAANQLGKIGGRTALLALMAADRGESESEIMLAASLPAPPPISSPPIGFQEEEEEEVEAPAWQPAGWSPESPRLSSSASSQGPDSREGPPPPPALRLYEPLAKNGFRALHRYSPHDVLDLGEQEVAALLISLARNRAEKPALRYFAIKNLTRFEHQDIRETLLDLLTDLLPLIRYASAEALSLKGDAESVPLLVEALEDPEASVRASAAHTLAALGGDMAIRPLLGLRDDEDEVVRYAARRALEAIGKRKKIGALLLRRAKAS